MREKITPLQARVDELQDIDRQLQDGVADDAEREDLELRKHQLEVELAQMRGEPLPTS